MNGDRHLTGEVVVRGTDQLATGPSIGTQPSFDTLGSPLFTTTFVVLDLETTGLRPGTDRITEVGAVKVRGGEVLGELQTFVHPGRPIPSAVTAITGITDAMVRNAPTIGQVLPRLQSFLGDAVLVAHNATFDVGFLRAALLSTAGEPFDPVVLDTARLARRLVRQDVRNLQLTTLARYFRSPTEPAHRALADARATVDVLHGLIERAGSLGATTFEDLRDLTRAASDERFRRISLVRDAPATMGVYRFLDAGGEVLYVGKATDLRTRLRTYFGQDRRRRTHDLVRETARVTWTPTPTLIQAEVEEVREIRHRLPRYNRRSKRTPTAAYVAITDEAFPRLSIVTAPRPAHRSVLGPLPSRRHAERIVAALQSALPVRSCTDRLRRAQDHAPCVMKDLGHCGAPCDGSQSAEDYGHVIARLEVAFTDPSAVLAELRVRMFEQAEVGRFERARELRGQFHAVASTLLELRRRQALTSVEELVLARDDAAWTDVVVIRRGRLAGSLRIDHTDTSEVLQTGQRPVSGTLELRDRRICDRLEFLPLERHSAPADIADAEEVGLLLAWADHRGTRIIRATGRYAEPLAGGRDLAAATAEARRVARAVRRDRQTLSRAKVARRDEVDDPHGPMRDTFDTVDEARVG